jgi:hypothetical protein
VIVRPLRPGNRAAWEPLARAYKAFYETTLCDAEYDAAWLRRMAGGDVHGVCADRDGALLGDRPQCRPREYQSSHACGADSRHALCDRVTHACEAQSLGPAERGERFGESPHTVIRG